MIRPAITMKLEFLLTCPINYDNLSVSKLSILGVIICNEFELINNFIKKS